MRNLAWLVAMTILLPLSPGCGAKGAQTQSAQTEGAQTEAAKTATPPTGKGHAPADAVPGSYEDWCEEHQVPESQDTRCNPSLVPAFQAANDWCADHGLPMSQCTIHNPNLKITRPPKPEGM